MLTKATKVNGDLSMNEMQMINIMEQYNQKSEAIEGAIKIVRVPDYKTVYVEQIGEIGRSIILNEYKVNGKTYRAGYSSRSETVFVSQVSRD
jgi:hypothetical protein